LRRQWDQPREDEPARADLDDSDVVLMQVLLERQMGISRKQHVEACRDRTAKQLAVSKGPSNRAC